MSELDEDNSLHELPLEFLQNIANSGGWCDGQAIIPDGDDYKCWCSCGNWAIRAGSTEEGLRAARVHTGSIPA
ncbi:hypothetical protein P5P86_09245 [Nocardioides sp. BP30]|uniref:hypothetical protein n=1 Tax=Nocardioides sp. BP30 TaxID=3036374 RepID=UPI0024692B67|nr:hypothetical protein [Nocardioides sp. BP30]WGL53995.1 hypothetical protein P5P86_09245 [Nocardioides sp. BP30]